MGKSNPKSGKDRRAKRKTREKTEQKLPSVWHAQSEKEERANNKLIAQSLRWKTDSTRQSFEGTNPNELSAKEIAILVTRRNMLSRDPEVSAVAVRNLIAMEMQNQKDEAPQKETTHNHLHVETKTQFSNATDQQMIDAAALLNRIRNK